ncbi:hypothetical protein ACJX0J_011740, partial [Zea mays]
PWTHGSGGFAHLKDMGGEASRLLHALWRMLIDHQVPGSTMRDSFLVNGVAFKKTFSYAGFEQQPKKCGWLQFALCLYEHKPLLPEPENNPSYSCQCSQAKQ